MVIRIVINLILMTLCLFFTACGCKEDCTIEPIIQFSTPPSIIESLPSAFPPLTNDELKTDWGKELNIANKFSKENDLYRAITAYKRALILIPQDQMYRIQQIEYDIVLSYYLGEKYEEAIETFEKSSLNTISNKFLAFDNLLTIIYDAYLKIGNSAKAEKVYELLKKIRINIASTFDHAKEVYQADFTALQNREPTESLTYFLETYNEHAKSVKKAKTLNAVLPGAGYYYIGQKNTAVTAFIVNSLFTAAAYYFFDSGNWPAGIIATSLEMGWYIGGINGAGMGAKEFNERAFENLGKEYMTKEKLFPVLSFQTSF